jgi:hypothetical protein
MLPTNGVAVKATSVVMVAALLAIGNISAPSTASIRHETRIPTSYRLSLQRMIGCETAACKAFRVP